MPRRARLEGQNVPGPREGGRNVHAVAFSDSTVCIQGKTPPGSANAPPLGSGICTTTARVIVRVDTVTRFLYHSLTTKYPEVWNPDSTSYLTLAWVYC